MTNEIGNYKLGELTQGFKDVGERLDKIEEKVDNLNIWRWQVVGAMSALSALVSFAVSVFK